jgi:hypothetical protein
MPYQAALNQAPKRMNAPAQIEEALERIQGAIDVTGDHPVVKRDLIAVKVQLEAVSHLMSRYRDLYGC